MIDLGFHGIRYVPERNFKKLHFVSVRKFSLVRIRNSCDQRLC